MGSTYVQISACLFRVCLFGTDAREENGHMFGEKTHRAEKIAITRGKKPHVYRVIILEQMADHTFDPPIMRVVILHSIGWEEICILPWLIWLNLWHGTINKMALVCGTRGRRSVGFFAALNIMSVCAESTPRRRTIDSGRFFEVGKQTWLAELRQRFAPISRFIGHTTWKLS